MPSRVRLVHETLLDGRFHVYVSPDVKGFHVTADTKAEAQREAIVVLDVIASRLGWDKPELVFQEASAHQAA